MRKYLVKFLISVAIQALFLTSAFSLELKIYDQLGLVRAFSKIKETGAVSVKIESQNSNFPDTLNLSNLDGLSTDKHLNYEGDGNYKAQNLGPGSWKIMLPDKTYVVKEVRIIE
jgi:hypothetical protein